MFHMKLALALITCTHDMKLLRESGCQNCATASSSSPPSAAAARMWYGQAVAIYLSMGSLFSLSSYSWPVLLGPDRSSSKKRYVRQARASWTCPSRLSRAKNDVVGLFRMVADRR